MSRKIFAQISVLVLFALGFLGNPFKVQAGGVCGGDYVVEKGQTVETIAATCGTTVNAIVAANPGISGSLSTGQVIKVPGANFIKTNTPIPSTPIPGTPVPSTPTNTNNYSTTDYYDYGTYIVQAGDTFTAIAVRFGVSVYDLWRANPSITDVNYLYVGQTINLPTSIITVIVPTAEDPTTLTYGNVPSGTPKGKIYLINNSNSDVYISLQGTLNGENIIFEYSVNDSMTIKVPSGYYDYVAYVGGQQYQGYVQLSKGGERSISFFNNKVVAK